jgi:hypothetical protein
MHLSSFADVSEDDIKLVMEQAQVSRAQAIKALQDHGYARAHSFRFLLSPALAFVMLLHPSLQ